jgi:signal transduction histidine kinase
LIYFCPVKRAMLNSTLNIIFENIPPESLIQFMAVAVSIGTVIILWKFGKSPEVKYLILVEILAAIWALTYGIEFLRDDLETKKFWSRLSYFGISFLPVCYFFFTTAFSQKRNILTPGIMAVLLILPFITVPVAMTDEYHHLLWKNVTLNAETNMLVISHGIWFWIFWIYSISLILAGLFNLFRSIYNFTAYYRSQVGTLMIATMIPLGGNLMYVTGINPLPGFDWTPVLFVFTGLVITFGVMKYRMFDLVPFARNKLIDTMSDGVIVINSEGFIEDYNPAVTRIFKLEAGDIRRKRFNSMFKEYGTLVKAITEGTSDTAEITLDDTEGHKYYQARFTNIFDRNHKFSGRLVQVNDVTSLKKTESRLKAEVEERGRLIEDLDAFAHTVAHDLRSSLGSVYASSEIMEECIKDGNTELLPEFAGMIKVAAQKAMHLTQELLILATVSHQEIEKKPLDMQRILLEAQKQVKDLIVKSKAKINTENNWPEALGYAPWVEEIWVNYLTNAIKYGGVPPVVTAGAVVSPDKKVRFWVKDNGNGILPEKQHLLFQKYMRLEPGKAEGYGLGLSIVKRIVDKLGGSVGLESTGLKEEGALFWFELPATDTYQPEGILKTANKVFSEEAC